jgi:threonine dehydrogenase-like Zn-dependent dehydrogenase
MRAAVMRDNRLVVDTIEEPKPGPGQVLVKTLACGICGSDLHMLKHAHRVLELSRRAGVPGVSAMLDLDRDVVMGHEFCAEILDYGPDTTRALKPGTRVCAFPVALSANGLETVGYSNDYPGGYGERMVVHEMMMVEVPNGLPSEHAALTEPLAVGVHAVELARLSGGEVPLVIGCGPVGLAVIAGLKLKGAGPVIAADFSPTRRALAEKLGADIVVDPAQTSPYRRWHDAAAPEGYNPNDPMTFMGIGPQLAPCVAFECVGVPGVIQQILQGSPRHARAVVVGACMEADQFEPMFGVTKELNVQFAYGYTLDEYARCLRTIAEGQVPITTLITGKVGVTGVADAFQDLASPERHAKIIVEPWHD